MADNTPRVLFAEFLGTALLLISVVGSGIMGEALADGNTAVALLANALATGCMLFVIITVLGPISGAHFNPIVTLAFRMRGEIAVGRSLAYIACQIAGGIAGVLLAHIMFDLTLLQTSTTVRDTPGQVAAEFIATFGLLFVIFGGVRYRPDGVAIMVAAYITGAYWFTASTSFANPAVTVARMFTDTFAGIAPSDVGLFVVMQVGATVIAVPVLSWLFSDR